jgi:hypothetical protein
MTVAPVGWPFASFAVENPQKILRPALLTRRDLSFGGVFHA